MEAWSCTRYWQKSFFENVLPTEGGEHIFIKFAKSGSIFHKMMHKSMRKLEKVIKNTFDRTINVKRRFPGGLINRKYTFFQAKIFFFDGGPKPKKGEPNGQKSDKSQKDGPPILHLRHSKLQKVDL